MIPLLILSAANFVIGCMAQVIAVEGPGKSNVAVLVFSIGTWIGGFFFFIVLYLEECKIIVRKKNSQDGGSGEP